MTTEASTTHWVRLRAATLSQLLPVKRATFPCAATSSNVLQTVEEQEVIQVMAHLLTRLAATRRCGQEPSRLLGQAQARERHVQVALDGKTLRGTLGHAAPDEPSVHLVRLSEVQTGVVLAQQAVPEKQNEISLEAVLLTPPAVHGRIITADAMHTQRVCCATITRFGGHSLFLAKGNQPTLEEDLRLFFREPPQDGRDWRQASTCDKGHGRREKRAMACQYRTERVSRHELAQRGAGLSDRAHRVGARADAPGNDLGHHQFVAAPSHPLAPPPADSSALGH